MELRLGVTTPAVFDDSPYYVDYESVVTIPDAPFVVCMIRERNCPVHVVGDAKIDILSLTKADFSEESLK